MSSESIKQREEESLRSMSPSERLRYNIPDDATFEDIVPQMCWGTFGIDGKGPLRIIRFVDASSDHLENILATQNMMPELHRRVVLHILRSRRRSLSSRRSESLMTEKFPIWDA